MKRFLPNLKLFIYIYILCAFTNLSGTIIEAPSLKVVENELKNLDENSLVVLDIDYTLIVPKDHILAPCGKEVFQKFMEELRMTREQVEILGSKISLQSKVSIIDENIFNLLDFLKRKGVKTITLTAMPTGKFGIIANAEEWRINQLRLLGIDLNWAFPNIDYIKLEGFEGKKSLPVFKKGILASSKYPKGQVLVAFLKHIKCRPSKIIFVDDRMEYIHSVETELDKENIPHISFHYTAATDQLCQIDENLANFQINYLLENGEWLSDAEASEQLKVEANFKCPTN